MSRCEVTVAWTRMMAEGGECIQEINPNQGINMMLFCYHDLSEGGKTTKISVLTPLLDFSIPK